MKKHTAFLLALSLLGLGCKRVKEVLPLEEVFFGEPEGPADPPAEAVSGERSCMRVPGFKDALLRSQTSTVIDEEVVLQPYGVELGEPVRAFDGYFVPLFRAGAKSSASVLWISRAGETKEIRLFDVHGDVGPAKLAGSPDRVFGVQSEMAARGKNLRTFTIERTSPDKFELVFGPELAHESLTESSMVAWLSPRGDTGLLVFESENGLSRLPLAFGDPGLEAARKGFKAARVMPLGLGEPPNSSAKKFDVREPDLVTTTNGPRLVYLAHPRAKEEAEDESAVEGETRALIIVQSLNAKGEPNGKPLSLLPSPTWVSRISSAGFGDVSEHAFESGEDGKVAFDLVRVGADGAMERRKIAPSDLDDGAAALPEVGATASRWFFGGGEGPLYVEPAPKTEPFRELSMEPGDPLLFVEGEVLTVTPRGVDLLLSLFACPRRAEGSAAKAAP